MDRTNDKALELLGLKPKSKKELQPVIIEKKKEFQKLDSDDLDSDNSISSQKLRDVIQYLKNDSDSISDSESDNTNDSVSQEKFNMFKPIQKQITKNIVVKPDIVIPKDRFIDVLERRRVEREQKELEKQKETEKQLQLEMEEKQSRIQTKYLQELLSTESLDLGENNDDFIEYKLRQQLSLDDL